MRALILSAIVVFGLIAGAGAQPFATPRALLEDAYSSYATDRFPEDPLHYYSSALRQLWAAADEKAADKELGAIDFDPFINAQDYELTNLEIGDPQPVAAGRVIVPVRFSNMGEPQTMEFTLVEESGSWLVDDIASTTPEWEFRLTDLLQAK